VKHTSLEDELVTVFGVDRVRRSLPLAPYTTFKVGGPADWFIETRTTEETIHALRIARETSTAVTLLGGGSNVLIGDRGIRGLVVRPRAAQIESPAADQVCADSGVTINGLVRWTINKGFAGLEAWAGTPGTVGGGVYGNAHYGGRLLGDLVVTVRLASRDGDVQMVEQRDMEFGYDRSRLQRTGEVLLSATFRVSPAPPARLREIARQSLKHRKRTQPLESPSAGCIFQNPDPARDRIPAGLPASAGALIDRAGMKGHRLGQASVSRTHANFIVNEGGATARDIRALIEACRAAVSEQFGVPLLDEIVYLGEF
jgi:UDP-N-acetylmuramate dehydrogenase